MSAVTTRNSQRPPSNGRGGGWRVPEYLRRRIRRAGLRLLVAALLVTAAASAAEATPLPLTLPADAWQPLQKTL